MSLQRAAVACLCLTLPFSALRGLPAEEPHEEPDKAWSAAQQSALAAVDARSAQICDVNRAIWEFAELGLEEVKSAALLVSTLKAAGFEVQTGVADIPTAFVASYGSGEPIIGILAEYDALPGMSQKNVPYREPVEDGKPGHACGHSGLGAGALGAALAVRAAMEQHGLAGTIRLYGTPAEETAIGKVYMLLAGQFADLDVCLHWHPFSKNQASVGSSKAVVSAKFAFKGTAAHASASPESGHSALDAVELMNVGVNYMREHVNEDTRIHYVITDGGGAPNVVPASAAVWYFIRADDHKDVENYFKWVNDVARGAALMTRTAVSVQVDSDCHELIPNTSLAEALYANLVAVGAPEFTDEEEEFARRLQEPLTAEFGTTFAMSLDRTVRTVAAEPGRGSTDVGDISWFVPTGGIRTVCFVADGPGHSWQNVACMGSSIGEKGMLYAARVLAVSAVELFERPDLVAAARADFETRMQGRRYTTLIPEGQKPPVSIR